VYGRVFGVDEFKYAVYNFKGDNEVAMATKFRQKSAKIALILVLTRYREILDVNSKLSGVCELKYAIQIFKGAKGVPMTTKFRQKYAAIAHILVL